MWKGFSLYIKETKEDNGDRTKPKNCIGQKLKRLFCENASVCCHYKNHVFFLVPSNKIFRGASLASDCLIPICVPTAFAKVIYTLKCTPTKRCLFEMRSLHSKKLSHWYHRSCWCWNWFGNVKARGKGLFDPLDTLLWMLPGLQKVQVRKTQVGYSQEQLTLC